MLTCFPVTRCRCAFVNAASRAGLARPFGESRNFTVQFCDGATGRREPLKLAIDRPSTFATRVWNASPCRVL